MRSRVASRYLRNRRFSYRLSVKGRSFAVEDLGLQIAAAIAIISHVLNVGSPRELSDIPPPENR